ncbi:hypothetical protein DHEL01_v203691 [Diaporthe helianthi]|uniref:Uncharacterized protein n=1 Tax=Diaporthe helianthi TaxID=158607 RepID=A0A2P5I618_DIAHE|nr:hypothetical protein DHEL01_v203691 [Diaporthe helianthi]
MARTPRFDPYERLLYRFFEAVYLLSLLGKIRGPHLSTVFDPASLISIRRRFLKNLAFLCDGLKGGDSTTSIAIEDRTDCYVFWVSSNKGPSDTTLKYLGLVLEDIKGFVNSAQDGREGSEDRLIRRGVGFSCERMRKQAHSLVNRATECINYLLGLPGEKKSLSLSEWLARFMFVKFNEPGLHQLCLEAFRIRNDPEMAVMEKFGQRLHNATCPEDISKSFTRVRHIIGRLAAHVRAVKQLLDDGARLSELVETYEISGVPVPRSAPQPPADSQTNLRGIMIRILKDGVNDARFEKLLGYLSQMDEQVELEKRLIGSHDPERRPHTVHAEVQMLHHFHDNGLKFAEADRYIATSKPACMCCRLYFHHHPATCVEPDTHQRVWPSWGPPLLPLGKDDPGWVEQRRVLNNVCHDIRKEVVMVIEQRQAITFAHPDSLTGDTHSLDAGFSESENDGSGDSENEDGLWDEDDDDDDGGVEL